MQELNKLRNILASLDDVEKNYAKYTIRSYILSSVLTFLIFCFLAVFVIFSYGQEIGLYYFWILLIPYFIISLEATAMRIVYEKEDNSLPIIHRIVTTTYIALSLGIIWLIRYSLYSSAEKTIVLKINKKFDKTYQVKDLQYNSKELVFKAFDFLEGTDEYEKNTKLAFVFLKKAAELGHTTAILQLGFNASDHKKYVDAHNYYLRAFELGNARGAYFIARMYEKGQGHKKNQIEALNWYYKAAQAGESLSQYFIGIEYIKGTHVNQNIQKGIEFITKSSEQGEYDALFYLGTYYKDPDKSDINLDKAITFLSKAVEHSETDEEKAEAYNELGRLWMDIWSQSSKQEDYQRGLQFFFEGKQLNHQNSKSNYMNAARMRPENYPSIDILLADNKTTFFTAVNKAVVQESKPLKTDDAHYDKESNNQTEKPKIYKKSQNDVNEMRELSNSLIIAVIFKSICFGIGIGIFFWARGLSDEYVMVLPFIYIIAVIIAGLPGLPKALNQSYDTSKKWDKFFGTAEYKAVVDTDRNRVTIKKNTDWFYIIFQTFLNLIIQAISMPFEVIRDIYRFVVLRKLILKELQPQE